jgi:putative spermidine/putrescine transport system ATP-binding protein
MQFELKHLQRRVGVTLVYVTHDQEEALTMSDRIAVMNRGGVIQVGTPLEIYNRPATRFVSDFIGDSNLIEATTERLGDRRVELRTPDGLRLTAAAGDHPAVGATVTLAVRPERVRLLGEGEPTPDNVVAGTVDSVNFQGGSILYRVGCGGGRFLLVLEANDRAAALRAPGAKVRVGWSGEDGVLLAE